MGNDDSVPDEIQDVINDFFQLRCVLKHLIGDVGLLFNERRDPYRRLDERLVVLTDLIALDDDAAEFNDVVILGGKTGGFQVKYHVLNFIELFVTRVMNDVQCIVSDLHFNAVDDLEILAAFHLVDLQLGLLGIRISLYDTYVGNGYCLLTELKGLRDQF